MYSRSGLKSDIDFSSSRRSTESSLRVLNDEAEVLSPDAADQRDALAVRKANELAAELSQDYKIPLLWEDHDCLMLENFELEFSNVFVFDGKRLCECSLHLAALVVGDVSPCTTHHRIYGPSCIDCGPATSLAQQNSFDCIETTRLTYHFLIFWTLAAAVWVGWGFRGSVWWASPDSNQLGRWRLRLNR